MLTFPFSFVDKDVSSAEHESLSSFSQVPQGKMGDFEIQQKQKRHDSFHLKMNAESGNILQVQKMKTNF